MYHTASLKAAPLTGKKTFLDKAMGKFYTPSVVGKRLARTALDNLLPLRKSRYRIVDPFCGDGRLLAAFLQEVAFLEPKADVHWFVSCWDLDSRAVEKARQRVGAVAEELGLCVHIDAKNRDSFVSSEPSYSSYDCVITNPPWDTLKPDRRELEHMAEDERARYQEALRAYDSYLAEVLPLSQPARKFAGWGTNLSRCGAEVSIKLTAQDSVCALVLPSSFLADQATRALRAWMIQRTEWISIDQYSAEMRLFDGVDQGFCALVVRNAKGTGFRPRVQKYDSDGNSSGSILELDQDVLEEFEYCLPIDISAGAFEIMKRWRHFGSVAQLEGTGPKSLWLGRELDETGHQHYLSDYGEYRFVKGRDIERYRTPAGNFRYVRPSSRRIPVSADRPRVVWRDVSRRSQTRRVQAAFLPAGFVTGNSLHVAYFMDDNEARLRSLLAIFNSVPFELQVRTRLGTGHISLPSVRSVRIPQLTSELVERLDKLVAAVESGDEGSLNTIEILVAKAYGLDTCAFQELLGQFAGFSGSEAEALLAHREW